jgi:hypothetical protein
LARARVGIKLDSDGILELMKSKEMGNAMKGYADKIASRAGDVQVVVDYERRQKRVISMVLSSFANERRTGGLARAMGEANL